MKANRLGLLLLLLLTVVAQLPAQQLVSPKTTNETAFPDFGAPSPESAIPLDLIPVPSRLQEAQAAYDLDARTNHITLNKPQYTNAPWSEIRLRAAALKGDGLAASLCSGSNAPNTLFWLSLAATNGWLPSQVRLAKEYEYERPKQTPKSFLPDFGDSDSLVGGPYIWYIGDELGEIQKLPRDVRQAAAKVWRSKAQAGLPRLKADAARNYARALYALGLLHQSGDLVESNAVLAAEMIHKAAESGLASAQESWGSYCEWHLTNHVEAAGWYYRAATQGLMKAQASLTSLHNKPSEWHFDPRFQPRASDRARWAYERASQPIASFAAYWACNELGDLYRDGLVDPVLPKSDPAQPYEGVPLVSAFKPPPPYTEVHAVEAVKWYRHAINMGISAYGTAEYNLALCYFGGDGVPQSDDEGLKWSRSASEKGYDVTNTSWELQLALSAFQRSDYQAALRYVRKLAVQGVAKAQLALGIMYANGEGVAKDRSEAISWYRKAAEQGEPNAQFDLGSIYDSGDEVPKDYAEALKWYRKAANQGSWAAQSSLGVMYARGEGVPQDYVEAYKWYNLAAAEGIIQVINQRDELARRMTPSQVAEGQRLAREFRPHKALGSREPTSGDIVADAKPSASGTGFFITEDGFAITAEHVVKEAAEVRLATSSGSIPAKVIKVDVANDLALLKAKGVFTTLPLTSSRNVKMGCTVATVGFPNVGLQGFAPKLAKGEIAALTGAQDDPRYFQISVPVQPGNSGGALVDERGNVVGVVSAKLSAAAALTTSGALPENVNYAVKSSLLLSFLESVPEVVAKLKEPNTKDRKFEDVVQSAEQAAVLVLVY